MNLGVPFTFQNRVESETEEQKLSGRRGRHVNGDLEERNDLVEKISVSFVVSGGKKTGRMTAREERKRRNARRKGKKKKRKKSRSPRRRG